MGDLVKPDANVSPSLKELQYVSRKMREEWRAVARDLNVTEGNLFGIVQDNQGEQEKIYQMLLHWKQKGGKTATRTELATALRNNERRDLAEYIETGLKPEN